MSGSSKPPFFDLFTLDMQRLVSEGVVAEFSGFEAVPLDDAHVGQLREYEASSKKELKGLYVLHYKGEPAYVGKSEGFLSVRLTEHAAKLKARLNIDVRDISFRCLYLDENWSALAHEGSLIDKLGCPWNNGGFGNHDPGRERDTTKLKDGHFDRLYPINPDLPIEIGAGQHSVWAALSTLKEKCPYLVRFESVKGAKPKGSHPEYIEKIVTTTDSETVKSLSGKIVEVLGADWQASFLFGYLILYKETENYSPQSCFLIKRGSGNWTAV